MKLHVGGAALVVLLVCSACLAFPRQYTASRPLRHLSRREIPDGNGGSSSSNATVYETGNPQVVGGLVISDDPLKINGSQTFGSTSSVVATSAAAVQSGDELVTTVAFPTVWVQSVSSTTSAPTTTAALDKPISPATEHSVPQNQPISSTSGTPVDSSTSAVGFADLKTSPSVASVETQSTSTVPLAPISASTTWTNFIASSPASLEALSQSSSTLTTIGSLTSSSSGQDSSAAVMTTGVPGYSTTPAAVTFSTVSSAVKVLEENTNGPRVDQSIKVTETVSYEGQPTLTAQDNSVSGVMEVDPSINSISSEVNNNTSSLLPGNSISPLGVTYDDRNSVSANNTFSSSVLPSVPAETAVPEPVDSLADPVPFSTDSSVTSAEPPPNTTASATTTVASVASSSVVGSVSGELSTAASDEYQLTSRADSSTSAEPSTSSKPLTIPWSGGVARYTAAPLPDNATVPAAEPETTTEPESTSEPTTTADTTTQGSTSLQTSTTPPGMSLSSDTEASTISATEAIVPGAIVPEGRHTVDPATRSPIVEVASSPSAFPPASSTSEPASSSAEPETTTEVRTPPPTTAEPTPEPSTTTGTIVKPSPGLETSPTQIVVTTVSEPEAKPETKPSPSPSPEPETTAESTPEPKGKESPFLTEAFAEPGPDWPVAKKQWSFAWEIHVYVLGGLFGLVGLYTLTSILCLWRINRLFSRAYFMVLNLLVFSLCALRAVYLLYDGYNSEGTFNRIVDYFLYSTAFPCLTAVFSILFFALLQATHMRLVPAKIQKLSVLIAIILFHFIFSIVTDIIVVIFAGMKIMLFVCQLIFVIFGLFLFFGYAYIFRQLYTAAVKRQKNFVQYSNGKETRNGPKPPTQKLTLTLAVKVTFVAAIFGLVTIGLEIYGMVQVYGVFSTEKPQPWPWWMYHTALRLTELVMCMTMAYIASQPFRYNQSEKSCACCFFCAPCGEMCTCQCCRQAREREEASGWSDNYASMSSFHNGRPVTSKGKLMLNGEDESPVVVQPGDSASADTQPDSLLIIEDGFVRFKADTDINQIVDEAEGNTGFINTAYRSSVDAQHYSAPSGPASTTSYSRKGSLASSGFFRYPSSLSLAESMASEMERAFCSLHAECKTASLSSVRSLPNGVLPYLQKNLEPAVDSYLEQQEPLNEMSKSTLRRSVSAVGSSPGVNDWWKQKLFRSRSDNNTHVRTRDVNNQRYMSLLDLERLKGEGDGFGQEECEENAVPTCIILRKEQSSLSAGDTDEIDV